MKKLKILFLPIIVLVLFSLKNTPLLALDTSFQNYENSGIALFPEKDTFVDSNYPETNFGQEEKILVSFSDSTQILFLKFNLDNLRPLEENEKALLSLWLDESADPLQSVDMELLLPDNDWEENELTWNNKPSLYSSGVNISLEATSGAQLIDLTDIVREWQDGTLTNRGLALYQSLEYFNRSYFSKESKIHPLALVFQRPKPVPGQKNTGSNMAKQAEELTIATQKQTPKSQVFGAKTVKFINSTLTNFSHNPKNIVPLVGLWVTCLSIILLKLLSKLED